MEELLTTITSAATNGGAILGKKYVDTILTSSKICRDIYGGYTLNGLY